MDAKAASEAAAAAEDVTAAVEARIMAETAMANAVTYGMTAAEKAGEAETAAMAELMIVGTMKSVGDTTVDAEAPRTEVVSGSGDTEQTVVTGLIDTSETSGPTTDGRMAVPADLDFNPPVKYKSPMVNAAMRDDLKIGKVVDSADDMIRLQIITAYAGTQSVKVYGSNGGVDWRSNKEGQIVVSSSGEAIIADDADFDADGNVVLTLRPEGMFYRADDDTTDVSPGGEDRLTATSPTDGTPPEQAGDTVTSGTKAKQVYSFVNTALTADPTTVVYVVLDETTSTTDDAGKTTTDYKYSAVTVHVAVDRDGIIGNENEFVTAALPAAKSYDHIHFGVWAGLGEAAKDGSQKIADLGIGFVQSIGDGASGADMPNNGDATYTGNWAASIQEAHPDGEGAIRLMHDNATVAADFAKGMITATLTNLATLKGDISGNTFSGDKASGLSGMHGLDTEAAFTGEFTGGFYGEKAAETAGVFDFSSKNNEGGAFIGAFGGAKDE